MASRSINVSVPNPQTLIPKIEIKTGQWNKVKRFIDECPYLLQYGYENGVKEFGTKLVGIIRRAIASGRMDGAQWAPLAEKTKEKYGDHPIYNLTGQYMRSIGVHYYKSRTLIGIPINVRKTRLSGKSTITLNQVAIILEYGTKNGRIPPRPIWKPAFEKAGGSKGLQKTLLRSIKKMVLDHHPELFVVSNGR